MHKSYESKNKGCTTLSLSFWRHDKEFLSSPKRQDPVSICDLTCQVKK